jgi:nicotinamidase-related amidase
MNELDPSRTALLALDFQNYGIHPEGYWAKHGEPDWPAIARPAAELTARVLEAARGRGILVVHVGVAWRPGSPEMNMTAPLFAAAPDRSVEGTWGSEFYEPVQPAPGEIVVYKRSVSALAGTELDRLFRVRDVNTLVLTGVATHFAVEGTARDAVDRGYRSSPPRVHWTYSPATRAAAPSDTAPPASATTVTSTPGNAPRVSSSGRTSSTASGASSATAAGRRSATPVRAGPSAPTPTRGARSSASSTTGRAWRRGGSTAGSR